MVVEVVVFIDAVPIAVVALILLAAAAVELPVAALVVAGGDSAPVEPNPYFC